jgi:catechol-2,3-dioxygenase
MKLNHLNLTVTDVPATRKFLEEYFGLRYMAGNQNITAMSDDDGLVLTLSSMKLANVTEVRYPGLFHIGFGQASEERVNEINRRLKEGGFDVPPPSIQHGAWTFFFEAPGGFTIEVGAAVEEKKSRG